jgi:hypothetical protein
MPNDNIISSPSDPVIVLDNQPVTDAANNGQIYDITTGELDVAANGFLAVRMTIPANQNKTIYILRLLGGASVNTTLDIFRNATFSGGTSITPVNNNWNYSGGSVCSAKYLNQATDPTTEGNLLISIVQTSGGILLPFDGRMVIPCSTTDRYFYIRLKNKTNQINTCSMSFAYWEK